jgi:putative ABC transport system permease protein
MAKTRERGPKRGEPEGPRASSRAGSGRVPHPSAFASSPWLRAPLMLVRYPGLLLAIGASLLILAVTSGASPLFLSSAGNASLARELTEACPWTVGLEVSISTPLVGTTIFGDSAKEAYTNLDKQVGQIFGGAPHLGPTELMILGQTSGIAKTGTRFGSTTIRLLTRDGALDHVTKLSGGGSLPGVWLADTTATELGVVPGDKIALGSADKKAKVPVAGIYRDLASQPRSVFWCGQSNLIFPLSAFATFTPPPFVIADHDLFLGLGARMGERGALFSWQFPIVAKGLTVPEAERTAAALDAGRETLRENFLRVSAFPHSATRLPFLAGHAAALAGSLRGSIETISVAGRIVALLVVGGAGIFWIHRRRLEIGLLSARGAGPLSIGSKVLLETLPIAILAGALGWLASIRLVRALGPGRLLDADAPSAALHQVIWTAALALVILGIVVAVSARQEAEGGQSRAGQKLARAPWEIAVLLLAAAALYEVRTRGPGRVLDVSAPPKPDVLVLLFPLLFVAGVSGLAGRLIRRLLPKLRAAGSKWSPSLYFASRRLASAPRIAIGLLTASALAIGILAYAGTLTASVDATSTAKAYVFVGSDVAVNLAISRPLPADLPFPSTQVSRIGTAIVVANQERTDVLGIDPDTFTGVAFWDPSFATKPLASLLRDIAAPVQDGRIPVIAVGSAFPTTGTLSIGGGQTEIPYVVVDTALSFPGLHSDQPMLVADRASLASSDAGGVLMLWAKGDPATILDSLQRSGAMIPGSDAVARTVLANPDFLSLHWTFGFLQALGVLTALIALGGILLYLEARQRAREVSYALARRMGLKRRSHRRSVAIELGAMLAAGYELGESLSWVAARLVFAKLDPMPHLPPHPLFRTPLAILFFTLLGALLAAVAGAWRVQRSADRANVAEVMRLAE